MHHHLAKEEKLSRNETEMRLKKISAEIDESIIQLEAMRDYIHDNHYSEAERCLNDVLKIFHELQGAHQLAEAKKEIDKAKSTLSQAKMNMHSEKEQIFSSLRKSTFQNIFDNMRDFFSAHNKFETVIGKLETLKNLVKEEKIATSSLQFFISSSTELKESAHKGSKLASPKVHSRK